jgi:hypothetical protein
MIARFLFALVAVFWLTMNYLLWRSEFGSAQEVGSAVPVEKIWQKVLTAPDSSALDVFQNGKKIGFARWMANVGEELTTGQLLNEELPEGQVKKLTHYTLDIEGNIRPRALTNNLRFSFNFKFSTNQTWQEIYLRVSVRPNNWEGRASALQQILAFKIEDDEGRWERSFKFSELKHPDELAREMGGPLGAIVFNSLGSFGAAAGEKNLSFSFGLTWQGRNDSIRFGRNQIHVYTLRTRILNRYDVTLYVSRVGEILRIDLPEEFALINDAFPDFKARQRNK